MSHELRTPLNAIIGFSEIISTQLFGAIGNAKYVGYANDIVESARHLVDIITSVLDLARSDVGKLQLAPQTVELQKVLDGCVTMIQEQCAKAGLRFRVVHPVSPLMVYGEPAKLRQIVINLLSNAMKFTKPGGEVSLIASARHDRGINISVVDTGIGMTAEEIPIALAPFGQIDSNLSRRYEGTGLGLPLTKALVELHGGMLTIASVPGEGTTVTVSLPPFSKEAAA
jgi:signal transduction histidine kinase